MTWLEALILGIVEGLTEYLPVSSTGHLILTTWLLGLMDDPEKSAAVYAFNIIIQFGAIVAVLGLYRQRVGRMARGVIGRDEEGRRLAVHLMVAFLPAAILGPLLDSRIETHLNGPWPVVGALFVGAWLMIAVAYSRRLQGNDHAGSDIEQMDWRVALLIGFGQCVAMWPGTSRSMMTIVTALLLGLRPRAAAEFSFLLGLITLSAATGYKALNDGEAMLGHISLGALTCGVVAAAVSAALAIKWFVGFLTRHGLAPFGWYRLALASVLAVLLLTGVFTAPAAP